MCREEIIIQEAEYLLEHKATVRQAAKHLGRSKSIIHLDMQMKLPRISPYLAEQVRDIFRVNTAERAKRGGNATKEKYARMRGKS